MNSSDRLPDHTTSSPPPPGVSEGMGLTTPPLPQLLELVPIRQVFPREADFEDLLITELEDDDSSLAALLGIDVSEVTRQQQAAGLRPDILVYTAGAYGTRCEAVIEITLELLDIDHLRRAVSYAIENEASSMIIITKAIDPLIRDLLDRYRESLRTIINVLILRTYLTADGQYGYHLDPAFPDQAEEESTSTAQRTLLEMTKRRLYELHDNSLQHLRVQPSGRIDWYPEGGHIRLYAAKAYTSITIKIFNRGGMPAHSIHRNMMRARDEFEAAVTSVIENQADYEISWRDERNTAKDPRLLIRIRYGEGRTISDLDTTQLEQAASRIAQVFHRLRRATMKSL